MIDFETFVTRLLHVEEEDSNKFIDLGAREGAAFLLSKPDYKGSLPGLLFDVLKERIGKPATTALSDSAVSGDAQFAVPGVNVFAWREWSGGHDPKVLEKFYEDAKKLTTAKGDNPVFLALGALRYSIAVRKETREVTSPLLIAPIRLVRSGGKTQPVTIEFVDDDLFFNPSLYEKLRQTSNARFSENFPLPAESLKTPIEPDTFDPEAYFDRVERYLASTVPDGGVCPYRLERDFAAISMYNNPDISMYRDIERNKERILAHPVVRNMFFKEEREAPGEPVWSEPPFVLPYDEKQFRILQRVLAGENLMIKGPPGTGKTQTIANMIAALLADGKRVLFASQKLSALAEVYNKTPDALKPFLLRLDFESERDAAKTDAKAVHKTLGETRSYRPQGKETEILSKRSEAYDRKFGALERLNDYKHKMFGALDNGDSLYAALVGMSRFRNAEPVRFDVPKKALQTKKQDFLGALETVRRAEAAYEKLTLDKTIPIRRNPWYSVKPEAALKEETLSAADRLGASAVRVLEALGALTARDPQRGRTVSEFPLDVVLTIAECPFTQDGAKKMLKSGGLPALSEKLKRFSVEVRVAADRIRKASAVGGKVFTLPPDKIDILGETRIASNLDLRLLARVAAEKELYNAENGVLRDDAPLPLLLNALRVYGTSLSETDVAADRAAPVFDPAALADSDRNRTLSECYAALKKYVPTAEIAPKTFDFKAKKALKRAKSLMRNPEHTDFRAAISALGCVATYNRYANQAAQFLQKAQNLLHAPLGDASARDLLKLIETFSVGGEFRKAVSEILRDFPKLDEARRKAGIPEDAAISVGELTDIYRAARSKRKLDEEFAELSERIPDLEGRREAEYYAGLSRAVEALFYLKCAADQTPRSESGSEDGSIEEAIGFGHALKKLAEDSNFPAFARGLADFYRKNFTASAYAELAEIRLKDLKTFSDEISDRSHLASAANYRVLLSSEKRLNAAAFFRPFQEGERKPKKGETLRDVFEYSYYFLVAEAVKEKLGDAVYALTRENVEAEIHALREAEETLFGLNAARTAFLAASRYDPDDRAFDFLKVNTSYTACRRLFADKAEEILRLKPCVILSPSSASLLLRDEAYFGFDVAVIDEASQMPPEYAIPIAARAKSLVVVGDENQMPCIRHFVRETEDGAEDGFVAVESCLELIKQNGSFAVESLDSHYRSVTETLIRYSQRNYYSDMVTFPTVAPRGESLGLFDVYVADGGGAGGENEKEADAVVGELLKHFDRFYDGEKKSLARSVGVVTFGAKQRDLVLKKIEQNRELYQKIRFAEAAAEVPERAFFARTIETVQGQETDCLILSVTYGKTASGKVVNNFGQLNNGRLGERIFNVAVTRAKYSVTLIHSFLPSDIKSGGLYYLKEYMEEVERFDRDEAGRQFLSKGEPDPFRLSVRDVLTEAGIPEERIVFDYGVTENSVRVPVAVLSHGRTRADFGVMLETEPAGDYIDAVLRYPDVLASRGWTLYRIFAFDWIRNGASERKNLIGFAAQNTETGHEKGV